MDYGFCWNWTWRDVEKRRAKKKEDGRKMTTFECTCGKVCSDLIQLRQHQADEIVAMAKKEGIV